MKRALFARLAHSRRFARALFGLELPRLEEGEQYFDATTLALARSCRRRVASGARVLDLGTGSFALLGLWLSRSRRCDVTCTEIDAAVAVRARECIRRNGATLPVLESSLLDGMRDPFDIVVFNPPYVPTRVGEERGMPEVMRRRWDGGADGLATIRAFLEAFAAQDSIERALFGANRWHVPRARLRPLVEALTGVRIEAVDEYAFQAVDVYALVRHSS